MAENLTQWFIETAKQHGIAAVKTDRAPNGGEVIYFDFPKTGYYNPYFMIWTGGGPEWNVWHAEFGHWYFPKNRKEERQYPTTEYYPPELLESAIANYARRRGS